MIRASIDIGSNSCLLLVAKISENGEIKALESEARVTSLGKDLDQKKVFLQESMDDTFKALEEYRDIINKYEIDINQVLVIATEASRVAKNSDFFFDLVKSNIGFNTLKISGEGEAFYTALGVCSGIKSKEDYITIMDIGGASTEIIRVKLNSFEIIDSISLPIGSVRASDWLESNTFELKFSELELTRLDQFITDHLICVAGTMTTLSAILLNHKSFVEKDIQGHHFSIIDLENIGHKFSTMTPSETLDKFPLSGKRAKSLYGGSLVALKIANLLKVRIIEISTLGLRYGVLKEGSINERFIK